MSPAYHTRLPSLLLSLVGFLLLLANGPMGLAQGVVVDDFEDPGRWRTSVGEGARLELARDTGQSGLAMRLDFAFETGNSYAIARRNLPLTLPDNYAFSFAVRGDAPANNFEVKLIDPSGRSVWWRRFKDFQFPAEWQRLTIKKKHLELAWGPGDRFPTQISAIEFGLSASASGKGSIWIDDLHFEEREPAIPYDLKPTISASTFTPGHEPGRVVDPKPGTYWRSGSLAESQWLLVDFRKYREYGGLVIDWDREDYATAYQVQLSDDGSNWTTVYTMSDGNGSRDYIPIPDAESRYLRLELQKSSRGQGYSILVLNIQPYDFSASPNQFFQAIARDAPRGIYPKYFHGEQTYWTVVGVGGDDREGLLNEEGMLEVDKAAFSIEPFLYLDGELITWNTVVTTQELEQGYLPIPSVIWRRGPLTLRITAFATGEAGASTLYARYRLENSGNEPKYLRLFLAVRPFQVNPPWQSLRLPGGLSQIHELRQDGRLLWVNQERLVAALTPPDRFGAIAFQQGAVTDYLLEGKLPAATQVTDPAGYASGALEYGLNLLAGAVQDIFIAVPLHRTSATTAAFTGPGAPLAGQSQLEENRRYWETRLNQVEFHLPPAADTLLNTTRSNVAYILINRDGASIQPGPRSYALSWIRDGALISAALLSLGYTEEVRAFIEWYARYQFADGRIPCRVDPRRGPDPVPENDSDGQFIYVIREYYRYTRDVGFLNRLWPQIVRTVEHIEALRRKRLGEAYQTPALLPFYGLVPESISHEGYVARPVHAYWDNFFTLRGLKDAAHLAIVMGDDARITALAELRDAFQRDLYASLDRTLAKHNIAFLPGSVELGDYDPTSTAIFVAPLGEAHNLPPLPLARTFSDYQNIFVQRRDHPELPWKSYSPYEIRIVSALIQLGQREFAHEMLDYFLKVRRPAAWNHWPEIIWQNQNAPQFLGDMPHTWIGSELLRAVRSLFAYERDHDQALVLAAGVPASWLDQESGISLKRLPTYYGILNYSLRREAPDVLRLRLSGDLTPPPGGIVLQPPLSRPLQTVTVNGVAVTGFASDSVRIGQFPADVVLRY